MGKGSREYFYSQLDKKFAGIKQRYIHTYGNSYEVSSPDNAELMKLFHTVCEKHGIWHNNGQIFRYLSTFEEKNSPDQLSLFDVL